MILWDSFDTADPSDEDREILYQIARDHEDLDTRLTAVELISEFPDEIVAQDLADVSAISATTSADEKVREYAFDLAVEQV